MVKFLQGPSPESPLYGRTPVRVELRPWSRRLALSFLEQGLSECGVKHATRELEEVLSVLGTLPGWLSFYGLRRCIGMPHGAALREAEEQAVAIASRERGNLLEGRGRWARRVVRMLAYGAMWTEMLRESEISEKAPRDFRFLGPHHSTSSCLIVVRLHWLRLAHRGLGTPTGSWAAVEPNGNFLTSSC